MILTVVVVDIVRSFWQTPLTLVNSLSIRHDLDASGGSVPLRNGPQPRRASNLIRADASQPAVVVLSGSHVMAGEIDETRFVGGDRGLDAAVQPEFEKEVGDVALDSGFLDAECACDVGVGAAFRHVEQDISRGVMPSS